MGNNTKNKTIISPDTKQSNKRNKVDCTEYTYEMQHVKDLLLDTLCLQSNSQNEKQVTMFVHDFIEELKDESIDIRTDNFGNIYITKGVLPNDKTSFYPCIVAHIDTVHTIESNKTIYISKLQDGTNKLFAKNANGKQIGIGGDDLVGVFAALQLLRDLPIVKIALFSSEEIGLTN